MNNWRTDLNRLAVEFHYGVGDLPAIAAWAEVANADTGEVHCLVWDLLANPVPSTAAHLLAEIAWDTNKFRAWSQAALPFAVASLRKAIEQFLARTRSVQSLCEIVLELDTIHVVGWQHDE
ncbi:hypothetical protein [Xanthomonas phaseoli]|uniref:hypothetical protein n=1 Tax=Xanthomonas phaseoli TaxID=1985254 RepID=UPI001E389D38|nr:hypothetical protein [Xanthomonas phaseoli]MCC8468960.1 hypothetical protein [Xanthomonas phaseoli]